MKSKVKSFATILNPEPIQDLMLDLHPPAALERNSLLLFLPAIINICGLPVF